MIGRAQLALALSLVAGSSACGSDPLDVGITAAAGRRPTSSAAAACPPPTVGSADGSCTLESDVRLSSTLELASGMTLDCRGRRLLPQSAGSGTTASDFVPSHPEAAVAMLESAGATLRNCGIGTADERFDFGVLMLGGGGHRLTGNTLHVRSFGAKIVASSANVVDGNSVHFTFGSALTVQRNSDDNQILGNQIRLVDAGPTGYFRDYPGMTHDGLAGRRVGINVLSPVLFRPLSTYVVNGRVLQYPSADGVADECGDPCPYPYGRPQRNLIEGNRLWLPGEAALDNSRIGIAAAMMSSDTIIRGNAIHEAGHGVRMAGAFAETQAGRAGWCGDAATGVKTDRRCQGAEECRIAGIDAEPLGTCLDLVTEVIDGRARRTVVEDNLLVGPFNDGRASFRAAIVAGNATMHGIVDGNQIQGTGIEAGITVATGMLQTGTIESNRIRGAAHGLLLQPSGPFGARIAGNDIVGSTVSGVGVLGAYTWPTVLSGNYWGHEEPPCFRSSDTTRPDLVSDPAASCGALAR